MTDSDNRTPLEILERAVQDFANATDPQAPVLLRSCVVVFETNILDEDGDVAYKVSHAATPRTGLAESVGLLRTGMEQVLACAVHHHDED